MLWKLRRIYCFFVDLQRADRLRQYHKISAHADTIHHSRVILENNTMEGDLCIIYKYQNTGKHDFFTRKLALFVFFIKMRCIVPNRRPCILNPDTTVYPRLYTVLISISPKDHKGIFRCFTKALRN